MPEEFIVEHAGARCMDQRSDGACVALDPATLLCTIYDDRPQTCRDFTRGESLCRRILAQPPKPRAKTDGLFLPKRSDWVANKLDVVRMETRGEPRAAESGLHPIPTLPVLP